MTARPTSLATTSTSVGVGSAGGFSDRVAGTGGPADAGRADAATRGRLRIPARVVQRIAAEAASEVGMAGGRSGGLFGIGARTNLDARPDVEVDLSSESVDLVIKLAVDYPVSLRSASQQVRDHVRERVQRLTGIAVHRIDIDIVAAGAADDRGGQGGLR